jgi:gamma-glutamyltranspeptidase/glutathione hydrolase
VAVRTRLILALVVCLLAAGAGRRPRGAVAADHVLASRAGAEILAKGGNAVDAAVAAALAGGVVQPAGSGLGGGGFALVASPGGAVRALDFREVAPAAAKADMFAAGASSEAGGLAVAVPAEGLGLVELHHRWGRLPLVKVAQPAVNLAMTGFETGAHLANALLEKPAMAAILGPGNRRPLLAAAIRDLARTHGEAFRRGWVAQDIVDTVRARGGVLTLADLAGYGAKEREPLGGTFRGHPLWTFPPPSSGGVALLQMAGATDASTSLHCRVEAAKHAMADRAAFGGDPDFVPVDPSRLLAAERVAAIRDDCAATTFPFAHYGAVSPAPDAGTAHISVIDGDGMAVALTTTINTSFGSTVVAAKSGIVLNNEMDDFATRPGTPNAFGLVQGAQNAPFPGKRPLSSMTPTIVMDAGGKPWIAVGASGGPFIITATWQVLANVIDGGMGARAAVSAPRWHHQWLPDAVMAEGGVATDALSAAGHTIRTVNKPFCAVQVVVRTQAGWDAASDPRKGGEAVVLP